MSYKPSEQELMSYLYNELDAADRDRVESYLQNNPQVKRDLEQLHSVSRILGTIRDKEVIAPPIVLAEPARAPFWQIPYFKTVASIAASLIIVLLAAKLADTNVTMKGNEFRLSFGPRTAEPALTSTPTVSPEEVQKMINESLKQNNTVLTNNWQQSQHELQTSIQKNLATSATTMNEVVRQASSASKEQIQEYVSTLQADNMKLVKDYFTLTSGEQKQYIEGLLVDFAKYLQQQRNDDLQLVQMRLHNIEKNNTEFKQETEQILTSIISSVGNPVSRETKY